jgi:AcrR family transcriptional regulator
VTRPRRSAVETRELVLAEAENLFYWNGIRATGVDTIATAAGIAPTTLYRLFASKDDLVDVYVRRADTGYRAWIEEVTTAGRGRSGRQRILALFAGMWEVTGDVSVFRGCPFLMTLAEYPDKTSAPHISAQQTKAWVRGKLHELAVEHLGRDGAAAAILADQLALVVEGIYASVQELGADGPAARAISVAEILLDATSPRKASRRPTAATSST